MTLQDHAARREALVNFDDNLVLVAGAGSGKTSLLVSRTLCAWIGRGIDPTRMLITTFTEKAASEMAERLDGALRELTRENVDENSDAGRACEALLEDFGLDATTIAKRAQAAISVEGPSILTFHAFCLRWLQDFARVAALPPEVEILDDVAAAFEYDLFWPDFVAQELDAKSTRSQATWVTLLEHFDFEGLARIARRAALEPSFRGLHIDWSRDELLAASKAALEALDADQVKDRSKLKYGDVARTCADLLREVLAHANDETLEVGLATRLGSFLSASATPPKPGKTDYPTEAEQEEAKLRLAQGRIALEAWSALPPRAIAEALEAFVARVGAAFEARLTRLGRLTFSECLVRCAALLRRSPAVRMNLRDRYSMILVDEFQDTDPLQYDMLFFLAQEGQARASDDPLRVTLRRGLLCIVGDPKQSIYRFRGADMRAYVTAVKAILDQGGRELDLSVNFRSEPEILDFVNLAVTPLFVANGYQAPRQDLASPKERRGAGEVVLLHVDCASKDDGRQREAAELVRFVLEDRRAHERSWSSYALLFRATTHIEDYARALRDAAVPILVEGSKRFYARSEVERFLALVRLVVAPWDEAAMLAYLRGPLAAVPDRELFTVAEASRADHDDRPRVPRPTQWLLRGYRDPALAPRLSTAVDELRAFLHAVAGLSADEVLDHALRHSSLSIIEAAGYEGEQRLANLEAIVQRAGNWARTGHHDLPRTLHVLEGEARSEKDATENPLADEHLDAVRLMTIHKAKGLEWDVVIVPDAARSEHGQTTKVELVLDTRRQRAILAALEGACSPSLPFYRRDHALHERAETERLFYVAATRARSQLVLSFTTPKQKLAWQSIFDCLGINPKVANEVPAALAGIARFETVSTSSPPPTLPSRRDATTDGIGTVSPLPRIEYKASLEARLRPELRSPSHDDEGQGQAVAATGPSTPGLAGLVGSVVHAYLHAAPIEATAVDLERLEALSEELCRTKASDASREVLREAKAILDQHMASQLAQRVRLAQRRWREIPLTYRDASGAAWSGSIDLLLEEVAADGRPDLVVVDYKTDRVDPGAIDSFVQRHRDQLHRYAEGVRLAWRLDTNPRAELWLLRDGSSHIVRAEPHNAEHA